MKDQIFVLMKKKLVVLVTKEELWFTLKAMAKGKALGPNGVIVEFFFCMWLVISKEYMKMIQDFIVNENFPLGVTKGLITHLHKGGEKKNFLIGGPSHCSTLHTRFL
jgi:hypothetical protein